jgi:hypothetical protein
MQTMLRFQIGRLQGNTQTRSLRKEQSEGSFIRAHRVRLLRLVLNIVASNSPDGRASTRESPNRGYDVTGHRANDLAARDVVVYPPPSPYVTSRETAQPLRLVQTAALPQRSVQRMNTIITCTNVQANYCTVLRKTFGKIMLIYVLVQHGVNSVLDCIVAYHRPINWFTQTLSSCCHIRYFVRQRLVKWFYGGKPAAKHVAYDRHRC